MILHDMKYHVSSIGIMFAPEKHNLSTRWVEHIDATRSLTSFQWLPADTGIGRLIMPGLGGWIPK